MERRIAADVARTQVRQVMDVAATRNERFIVDRHDKPAVIIMSARDFIRAMALPPDWLQNAWPVPSGAGLIHCA